jgi:hypothetical protein
MTNLLFHKTPNSVSSEPGAAQTSYRGRLDWMSGIYLPHQLIFRNRVAR